MSIEIIQTCAKGCRQELQVALTGGMGVLISSGPVKYGEVVGVVEETEHDVAVPQTRDEDVRGYIVVDEQGSLDVLVDEEEGPFVYDFEKSPYEPLALLFAFSVPLGTTDLADLDISVFHIVPYEKRAPRAVPTPKKEETVDG